MEKLFIIMLVVVAVVAFIIALVSSILKGLYELLCGFCQQVSALFAGAGIYGIITVAGVVVFIIAIIYIINS